MVRPSTPRCLAVQKGAAFVATAVVVVSFDIKLAVVLQKINLTHVTFVAKHSRSKGQEMYT